MDLDKTLNDISEKWSVCILKGETGGILDTTKENYDSRIEWHDEIIPKPTWKELETRWELIKDDPEQYWNIEYVIQKSELELKIEGLESRIITLEELVKAQAELMELSKE